MSNATGNVLIFSFGEGRSNQINRLCIMQWVGIGHRGACAMIVIDELLTLVSRRNRQSGYINDEV